MHSWATRIFNMHLMALNSKHVHFPSWKWTCLQIFWLASENAYLLDCPNKAVRRFSFDPVFHFAAQANDAKKDLPRISHKYDEASIEIMWMKYDFHFDLVLRTSSGIPVELKKSKWHTHSSLLKGYHFSCNIRTTQEARTCEAWFQLTFRPKMGPESRIYGISCLRSLAPMWRGDCDAGSDRTWRIADQLVC
jgi:hypothetical protein